MNHAIALLVGFLFATVISVASVQMGMLAMRHRVERALSEALTEALWLDLSSSEFRLGVQVFNQIFMRNVNIGPWAYDLNMQETIAQRARVTSDLRGSRGGL